LLIPPCFNATPVTGNELNSRLMAKIKIKHVLCHNHQIKEKEKIQYPKLPRNANLATPGPSAPHDSYWPLS